MEVPDDSTLGKFGGNRFGKRMLIQSLYDSTKRCECISDVVIIELRTKK
jgi:hypothetical protein